MKPVVSLKHRAVALLAQRDQSEMELRRKLLHVLERGARSRQQAAGASERDDASLMAGPSASFDDAEPNHMAQVDEVIAWLRAHDYLNDERFIESRIRVRAARSGTSRIRAELAQHGLVLPPHTAVVLRDGELERAQALWTKRFGQPPSDLRDRAKQSRFLLARGFAPAVIARVLRGAPGGVGGDEEANGSTA